jgi:flavin reductase (DIM6/NTAB) family NADH-FMN oxidoreductase RutF
VFDELDFPMFIATVPGDGCLIGFATQCSIDPPRFLACLSDKNRTYRLARDAEHMAVHVVPHDRTDLAELFGGETGDEVDKLARCEWSEGPGGVPLIAGCPYLVGRIRRSFDVGDHVAFELDVVETEGSARPLLFQRAKHIEPGHEA